MNNIKLKVCGMRNSGNIDALAHLRPDYMGFIFYPRSKRFADKLDVQTLNGLTSSIVKTGVFVDASAKEIKETVEKYSLGAVQLHGSESPALCHELKSARLEVIKAFGMDENFDFEILNQYKKAVDYFLFDTKTTQHGGSGRTFDWNLLSAYSLDIPYFLSGGLSAENINTIQNIRDERLYALDLNSRFELEPGLKNIEQLKTFFTTFKRLQQQKI